MLSKLTVYVVRTDASHRYKESAPCRDCMKVLKDVNVKKIIFSENDGTFTKTNPASYSTNHVSLGNRHLLKQI